MPIHNREIADVFNRVADLLDIEGENQFRIRAYRKAARIVVDLPRNVGDMVREGEDLTRFSGIGKDLAGKIKEIVETGVLGQLKELEKKTPPDLSRLMKMEGLGPKRVQTLHKELGINDLDGLKKAAEENRIRKLEGFGEKTEKLILEALERMKDEGEKERIKLFAAEQIANDYVDYLKKGRGIKDIAVAGSYRRRMETVGDLDILVTCKKGSQVMERFVEYEDVAKVLSKGTTRSSVVLRTGLHVDLRLVPQVSYGAALHYFTGSRDHNIAVRGLGVKLGLKINEYGVFRGKDEERVAGRTEEEVYRQVGLPYIEPELRENRGEIEAARNNKVPILIRRDDIRGDLHVHTNETDGRQTLEEMVQAAREQGYEYLAITDHSKRVTMAKGLDARRLAKQIDAIDTLNGKVRGIRILKGIELDILEDGSLDLPDDILKELDLTVCSIHYNQNLSRKRMTERVIRAMDNPFFTIFAHPTGRLIGGRKGYEIDLEAIMKAAGERGCVLELNAHPDRLDLDDHNCRMAKEMGLRVVISTDSHSSSDLDFMRFGVYQARRGWLEKDDVLNTRSFSEIEGLLKRK
ncbi:MAG TPA: DNA polymerase/3'-5' exonuclease PolX [Syntrophorhabdaceae bacterium]|nr:DNA polymerase/3'-5' exonuclease PolX [Syntrophorhabdaceae bacterium]